MEIFREQIRNAIIQTVDARGPAESPNMQLLETVIPMLHIPLIPSWKIDIVNLDLTGTVNDFVEAWKIPLSEIWMIELLVKGASTASTRILFKRNGSNFSYTQGGTTSESIRDHIELGEEISIGLAATADVNDTAVRLEIIAKVMPY